MFLSKLKILLADDHKLIREGIGLLLKDIPNIVIVGEATNGKEAVEKANELKPDLILMDVQMPEMDGLEATRRVKENNPMTRVIILTVFGEEELVKEAVRSGAEGYILKDVSRGELIRAIQEVSEGKAHIHPKVARSIFEGYLTLTSIKKKGLTEREREILNLMSQGKTNKEIASELSLSIETIKTHIRNIFEKLEAVDRAQAVAIALRKHLLQ